jgi:ubiquinone/menaquinone biosynthesis C-methylase UbiE
MTQGIMREMGKNYPDKPHAGGSVGRGTLTRFPAADLARALSWLRRNLTMSMFRRVIKGLVIGGACGVGLCAIAKKAKLSDRIVDFAQNVEGVPFPGTRLYAFLASRQLRSLYREIADEIADSGIEGKVLDLGTDLGYVPIELARKKPSLAVIGIDTSSDMVQIAEANARSEGVNGKPEFGVGDPTNLPFPGRYFDLVVSINVLRQWAEPRAVFAEVHHILNSHGEFWVYGYKKDIPRELWLELADKLPAHQRVLLQLGPAISSKAALGEDEIIRLAQEAHFEVVSTEDKCLTMFHECMPVFVKVRLKKPELIREQ